MEMLIALGLAVITPSFQSHSPARDENPKVAVACFKTGEQTSGMNKICYYDCLGSQAAITIGAVQLCPLSIDR